MSVQVPSAAAILAPHILTSAESSASDPKAMTNAHAAAGKSGSAILLSLQRRQGMAADFKSYDQTEMRQPADSTGFQSILVCRTQFRTSKLRLRWRR